MVDLNKIKINFLYSKGRQNCTGIGLQVSIHSEIGSTRLFRGVKDKGVLPSLSPGGRPSRASTVSPGPSFVHTGRNFAGVSG